jgi:hypothetical protein
VLTEEEMNQCLKGDGERVRKFTEHEDQHKEKYNHTRKLFRERCKKARENPGPTIEERLEGSVRESA